MVLRPTALGSITRSPGLLVVGLVALTSLYPVDSSAQRPFRGQDPFYRGESARRTFFDNYALTSEIAWLTASGDGESAIGNSPVGLLLRLDYQLLPHFDAGAVIDATGSTTGRTLSLSWIAFKYYRSVDLTDYALRLAVDPSIDGQIGFPQADLAFITTTLLAPRLASDMAMGIRRVRRGYETLVPMDDGNSLPPETPSPAVFRYSRALGWELHLMMQYSYLLNPARSSVFASVMFDRGQYNIVETSLDGSGPTDDFVGGNPEDVQGTVMWDRQVMAGALWFRTGVEYNRPEFQFAPFVSLPLTQWVPDDEEGRANINVGVRFTLR